MYPPIVKRVNILIKYIDKSIKINATKDDKPATCKAMSSNVITVRKKCHSDKSWQKPVKRLLFHIILTFSIDQSVSTSVRM